MKERPILFSSGLVRAILESRKTQTRRLLKLPPDAVPATSAEWDAAKADPRMPSPPAHAFVYRVPVPSGLEDGRGIAPSGLRMALCPFGAAGDRLWVRETWAAYTKPNHEYGDCDEVEGAPSAMRDPDGMTWVDQRDCVYAADDESQPSRWRPSIHMPRWASRIDLEVTGVRVERLQDISEEDARAEGANPRDAAVVVDHVGKLRPDLANTHRGAFACLWETVAPPGAEWASNPLVWVVGFKRVEAKERAA